MITRRQKTTKPKRTPKGTATRNAHATPERRASKAGWKRKIAEFRHELKDAVERQAATSEILRLIATSPTNLSPLFDVILAKATRFCAAKFGIMFLYQDRKFRCVALRDVPQALAEFELQLGAFEVIPGTTLERLVEIKEVIHVEDIAKAEGMWSPAAKLGGARSYIAVPMIREGELTGAIAIYRQEVQPFSTTQIELVTNFASQAVIAIQNTRLLSELRESLQRQTATSNVLEAISRSVFDLHPVFQAVAENSVRLCGADRANIFRFDGEVLRMVSAFNVAEKLVEWLEQNPIKPGRHSVAARAALERRTIQVADVLADPEHTYGAKHIEPFRTVLAAPILRGDELLGVILVYHTQVRPFTDKQIALVETFADQAAIAIENVRLLDELRHRTEALARSVAELRALGEVSQAANSTLDLQTVLSRIVAKAVQLSDADAGSTYVFDGVEREFRMHATCGMDSELIDVLGKQHISLGDANVASTIALREPIQIADLADQPPTPLNDILLRAGYRALLVAPLFRGEDVVGLLVVRRKAPGQFADGTIELIKTLAAQSVSAIENARLFHQVEEKSRQLELASEHKSRFLANMSHELRTPLNAILGYAELILDNIYGDPSEKMREALHRIEHNGKHLLGLINDVLDLSKIEAGQLTLSSAEYSLDDVVRSVYAAVAPLAAEKDLGFEITVQPDLPRGLGDERRLTQVLLNLVGNAIKFTDSGKVMIAARAAGGCFNVDISDTGPGISTEDQAKLFQEFQQADNSITRKKGGSGLGLAISKRIIEMHGGSIWVDSRVGEGSTFSFVLPVTSDR